MLPASEPNDSQQQTHTVLEESKPKADTPSDDLPRKSIKTGRSALIHLFHEIFILHSFNLQL